MANEVEITDTFWTRLGDGWRRLVRPSTRHLTRAENEARSRLADAETELARLREDLRAERLKSALLESDVRIAQNEVMKLAEVVERDRKRIEAETAALSRKVAEAQAP